MIKSFCMKSVYASNMPVDLTQFLPKSCAGPTEVFATDVLTKKKVFLQTYDKSNRGIDFRTSIYNEWRFKSTLPKGKYNKLYTVDDESSDLIPNPSYTFEAKSFEIDSAYMLRNEYISIVPSREIRFSQYVSYAETRAQRERVFKEKYSLSMPAPTLKRWEIDLIVLKQGAQTSVFCLPSKILSHLHMVDGVIFYNTTEKRYVICLANEFLDVMEYRDYLTEEHKELLKPQYKIYSYEKIIVQKPSNEDERNWPIPSYPKPEIDLSIHVAIESSFGNTPEPLPRFEFLEANNSFPLFVSSPKNIFFDESPFKIIIKKEVSRPRVIPEEFLNISLSLGYVNGVPYYFNSDLDAGILKDYVHKNTESI